MKLWFVSMECAGIAEAGGVKNVTFSLCKEFAELGHRVTLFIPVFKCNTWDIVRDLKENAEEADVSLCGCTEKVKYSTAVCTAGGFNLVFINHPAFAEKEAVYTYTDNEQKQNPEHLRGQGHKDGLFMDILFQKSVSAYLNIVDKDSVPDIVHCQDASTAVLPAFIKENPAGEKVKSVVTIHNAGPFYHHEFASAGEAAWYTGFTTDFLYKAENRGKIEPFLIAAEAGAELTTVSEVYAEELTDPANSKLTDGLAPIFNTKNITIKGITNGFDFDRYNPEDVKYSKLPFAFAPEKLELAGKIKSRQFFINNVVNSDNFDAAGIKKFGKLDCSEDCKQEIFIAYHGRVTSQKGINVLAGAIPAIIRNFPEVRFVIAGQGESILESNLVDLTDVFPGKITYMNGYNQAVVRQVTAVSDFIVLPSYFEPCGLEDFIAQSYGTVPVAHKTGGLNKIEDGVTGFLYEVNESDSLVAKLSEVITIKKLMPSFIENIIKAGALSVHNEYYWKNVIQKKYLPFFEEILKK